MGKEPVTVAIIVERLGGRDAVAELCGVKRNAVGNWCVWNAFPRRAHLDLHRACREKRIALPEELFDPPASTQGRSIAGAA